MYYKSAHTISYLYPAIWIPQQIEFSESDTVLYHDWDFVVYNYFTLYFLQFPYESGRESES